ncbi:hypothetical protein ACVDFE_07875 [Lentzea chajnantorensis]
MSHPTPQNSADLDNLSHEQFLDFLATRYGVHRQTFHAFTLADWAVYRVLHAATEEISSLRVLHGDHPVIEQAIEGLHGLNPMHITDAALRKTDTMLGEDPR